MPNNNILKKLSDVLSKVLPDRSEQFTTVLGQIEDVLGKLRISIHENMLISAADIKNAVRTASGMSCFFVPLLPASGEAAMKHAIISYYSDEGMILTVAKYCRSLIRDHSEMYGNLHPSCQQVIKNYLDYARTHLLSKTVMMRGIIIPWLSVPAFLNETAETIRNSAKYKEAFESMTSDQQEIMLPVGERLAPVYSIDLKVMSGAKCAWKVASEQTESYKDMSDDVMALIKKNLPGEDRTSLEEAKTAEGQSYFVHRNFQISRTANSSIFKQIGQEKLTQLFGEPTMKNAPFEIPVTMCRDGTLYYRSSEQDQPQLIYLPTDIDIDLISS
jgi:hypothetical protein